MRSANDTGRIGTGRGTYIAEILHVTAAAGWSRSRSRRRWRRKWHGSFLGSEDRLLVLVPVRIGRLDGDGLVDLGVELEHRVGLHSSLLAALTQIETLSDRAAEARAFDRVHLALVARESFEHCRAHRSGGAGWAGHSCDRPLLSGEAVSTLSELGLVLLVANMAAPGLNHQGADASHSSSGWREFE